MRAPILFLALARLLPGAPLSAQEEAGREELHDELEELRARVQALEEGAAGSASGAIDLDAGELTSIDAANGDTPLSRPWWENVQIRGLVAAGFIDSGGGVGFIPDGAFFVDQASIFVEAELWEDASVFSELQLVRYSYDYDDGVRTGELYGYLHNLFADEGEQGLGIKVGRVELPFGEDYLHLDADENPLISYSAGHVYGVDEGVLVHGRLGRVDWYSALTSGTFDYSFDDDPARLVCGKLATRAGRLHVSASAAKTGDVEKSAFLFSGKGMFPVGGGGMSSTAGVSPSTKVDTTLWELDAELAHGEGSLCALVFGGASIDDPAPTFDRSLVWFSVEERVQLGRRFGATVRYSEAGTYDDEEGYLIDGMIHASGRDFGFDASRLQRLSLGVDWTVRPRVVVKLEVGRDRYELIDGSPFDPQNDERFYGAFELVASY